MIRLIIFYVLFTFSAIFIILNIKNIFETIRKGELWKGILFIALNLLVLFLAHRYFSIFGFTLSIFSTELLFLGLLNFIITLYDGVEFESYEHVLVAAIVVGLLFYFIGFNTINKPLFDRMPNSVNAHYVDNYTKKHAKKLNPETELKEILNNLDNSKIEISKETINLEISRLEYKKYNGIYCYFVEDKGDYFEIGMTTGENNYFFQSKEMGKPYNFIYSKDSKQLSLKK